MQTGVTGLLMTNLNYLWEVDNDITMCTCEIKIQKNKSNRQKGQV